MGKYSFRYLFIDATKNSYIQFIRYALVGGVSFLVDAMILFILEKIGVYYLLSASVGFVVGLIINYALSKRFVFTAKLQSRVKEFTAYAVIGALGLALTELLLYIFVDFIHMHLVLSKIVAAGIVLVWNYIARKYLLYNKKHLTGEAK